MLSTLLLIPAGLLTLLPPLESGTPLPSSDFRGARKEDGGTESARREDAEGRTTLRPLAAVTTWRAHMMLMTVLCILAVDFPAFPRALAKCETYGVSLVRLFLDLVLQSQF